MESPTKTKRIIYGAIAGLGIFAGAVGVASAATGQTTTSGDQPAATAPAAESHDANEPTIRSSVTVADNGKELSDAEEAAQLKGLAKTTEDEAKAAATAAVPGTVTKAELENEDGNVVYDIEIKGADGKVTEVIVDAGNGKVLHQEAEEADDHDSNDTKETNDSNGSAPEVTETTTATAGN